MKRRLLIFSAVLLVMTLLAACGSNAGTNANTGGAAANSGTNAAEGNTADNAAANTTDEQEPATEEPVKLTLLNGAIEAVDWLNEQIEAFQAKNPSIKISQEFQKGASDVLKIKVAAGDAPDIVALANIPQEFFDQDLFHDFSADNAVWDRLIDPGVKEAVADPKRPDKSFTIPFSSTYTGMYYDKKLIAELGIQRPDTWEQMTAALQTVKEKKPDLTPLYLGGKDSWILGHLVQFFPLASVQQKLGVTEANTAMLANDASKLEFDKPGGVMEVFAKNMLELKDKGLINKNAVSATYDSQLDAIANGKAAFVIQGMWALGDIQKKNPNVELGFWPIPSMFQGEKPFMIGAPDGMIAYSSKSEHQEAAQKFVDFIVSAEVQQSYSKLRNAPSIFKDAQVDWSVLSKDIVEDQQVAFLGTRWPYTPSGYNGDAIGRTVQDLLVGKFKTPDAFAKEFRASWDKGYTDTAK